MGSPWFDSSVDFMLAEHSDKKESEYLEALDLRRPSLCGKDLCGVKFVCMCGLAMAEVSSFARGWRRFLATLDR